MELTGERLIQAPRERVWQALNDPEVLKECIAGCETLERSGPDAFAAVVAVRVGPVSARFKGALRMTDIVAPEKYTLHFDGQGGVAGFGKGSADVVLAEEGPQQTRLRYAARAQVGGKMAQVGSRLIDATAGKMTEAFFSAFEARLRPAEPEPEPEPEPATPIAAPAATAPVAPAASKVPLWAWVAGALLVLALLVLLFG
jgi:carbon monoxide dehydrogenase subunit G